MPEETTEHTILPEDILPDNVELERPDYKVINDERVRKFKIVMSGGKKPDVFQKMPESMKVQCREKMVDSMKDYYRTRPVEFIQDWGVTYDPRNIGTDSPAHMPFCLFERQKEFILFLWGCMKDKQSGAIEKCRDVGATWVACNFSVWVWSFHEGASIGWGSRKESLVDRIGDPDSIFEKMRMVIDGLPNFLKPEGFDTSKHSAFMRLINPENSSTITGEAGDAIGRGGRKTIYFKDESAHYERPHKIEAALMENTDVQIDMSSVYGPTTVFQRRVDNGDHWSPGKKIDPGIVRVFIFDWRDHPFKTQKWYDLKKAKAEREGLLALFAQEVDRDASAAVEGVLIPGAWVKAAIDSHKKIGIKIEGETSAALDLSDEGTDKHALSIRKGILLRKCKDWAAGDVGVATNKAILICKKEKATSIQYDSIGVGAGAKAEINRMTRDGKFPENLKVSRWNASKGPLNPKAHVIRGDRDSPKNVDYFLSLKSQGYWKLRERFEKTYKVLEQGASYPEDELISLDSTIPNIHEIVKELSQPTYSTNGAGKIVIDKKPEGSKSPNNADSIMMNYWPITSAKVLI